MFAQAQIKGNIGRIDFRPSGQSKVANFSLACNEKRNGVEVTHWFTVAAWDRLADLLEQYAPVGSTILINGRLHTRSYNDKDGITRFVTEITATAIDLIYTKRDENGATTESSGSVATTTSSPANPAAHRPDEDDDLPF